MNATRRGAAPEVGAAVNFAVGGTLQGQPVRAADTATMASVKVTALNRGSRIDLIFA